MSVLWPTDSTTSALMRKVRRTGTSPERRVQAALRRIRVRFSLVSGALPGKPDLVNRQGRWAIFVHGCFWHSHASCRRATLPARNRESWKAKFVRNRSRDRRVVRLLRGQGYRVLVVWECETNQELRLQRRLQRFVTPEQNLDRDWDLRLSTRA